jgi:hypothetical protein
LPIPLRGSPAVDDLSLKLTCCFRTSLGMAPTSLNASTASCTTPRWIEHCGTHLRLTSLSPSASYTLLEQYELRERDRLLEPKETGGLLLPPASIRLCMSRVSKGIPPPTVRYGPPLRPHRPRTLSTLSILASRQSLSGPFFCQCA